MVRGRSSATLDVAVTYVTQLATLVIGLGASIFLARTLGPSGRGVVQVVQTITSEAVQLLSLGVAVSVIYVVARGEFHASQVAAAAGSLAAVAGIVLAAALVFGAQIAGRTLLGDTAEGSKYVLLAAPIPLLLLAQSNLLAVYRGENLLWKYNALVVINRVLYVGMLVVMLVALKEGTQGAIIAILLSLLLSVSLLTAMIGRQFGFSTRDLSKVASRLIRFNSLGNFGTIVQALSYRFDIFVLAAARSTAEVGLYAVAVSVATVMWYIPDAFGRVLLSRSPKETEESGNRKLIAASHGVIIGLLLSAGVVVATSPVVIPWAFGERFRGSVPALLLLMPGIVALAIWKVLANGMTGRGFPNDKFYSAVAGAIATVGLDLLLIPGRGLEGAAVASSIGYSVTTAFIVALARRHTGIPIHVLLIPTWTSIRSAWQRGRGAWNDLRTKGPKKDPGRDQK